MERRKARANAARANELLFLENAVVHVVRPTAPKIMERMM